MPWRKTADPYKIWISEVMLQQTTVNAVIPYYQKWITKYPTVEAVAKAKIQPVLNDWQGLGYYSRARNIHKAAGMIVRDFGGQIPRDPQVLKKLPGFGPYTVGAVLSIAYDIPHPIIDANIRRVVMRLKAVEGLADVRQDKMVLEFYNSVMPRKGVNIFNQAMMELGALVCRNKQPLCLRCPVRRFCAAYDKGVQDIIPTPKKKVIKDVHAAIAVIQRNGAVLMQKRPSKGLFADLWEFPGGKIEAGESAREAVAREIREELGVGMVSARELIRVKQYYTEFRAHLNVFDCVLEGAPDKQLNRKFIKLNNLKDYPMPSGTARIVEFLERKKFP